MASIRKPSIKSRAALAASTAVPVAVTADVLDHAGEQAAMLAAGAAHVPEHDAPEDTPAEAPPGPEPLPETAASLLDEAVYHTLETAAASLDQASEPVTAAAPSVEDVPAALSQTEAAGVEVAREASVSVESAAEQVTSAAQVVEAAQVRAASATSALSQIQTRMADAMQSSFDDALSYWSDLMAVRSMPDAVSLHARHLHRQVEVFTLQSREFAVLVQKAAADVMDPFRRMPAN